MKISKNTMAIILTVTVFSAMALTKLLGVWDSTDGLTAALNKLTSSSDSLNVSEIRGSSTFKQVSSIYNVPMEDIALAFTLGDGAENMKVKELEGIFKKGDDAVGEVGTESFRFFIALYLGEEYMSEGQYLPQTAVKLLDSLDKLSDENRTYFESHTVENE